jgi:hypothetical protein
MRRAFQLLPAAVCLCVTLACANTGPALSRRVPEVAASMDQVRMEMIFADQVAAIEGPSGALRTIHDGVEVYLISDPEHDQMRLLSKVAAVDQLDPRVFNILLQANFYLTFDARYAVSDGVVFGVFVHPISTLTESELVSAFGQVVALSKNFGTTFSSDAIDLGISQGERR